MINIIYPNGVKIPAYDDGTPVSPMPDWTQDVYDTIRERFEAGYFEEVAPPVDVPAPDWLSFNLAMIPPTTESSFEVWLGQFKEPYRAALVVASSEGNAERVQGQYEILKDLALPTAEQIAEWQGIADRHNIRLTF